MRGKGLIPNSERTHEELSANGRKGALKSLQVRRRKKELRSLLTEFLSTPVRMSKEDLPEEIITALKERGYSYLTLKERGALLLALRMSKGDIRASLLVSKLIGEYDETLSLVSQNVLQPVLVTVSNEDEADAVRTDIEEGGVCENM